MATVLVVILVAVGIISILAWLIFNAPMVIAFSIGAFAILIVAGCWWKIVFWIFSIFQE